MTSNVFDQLARCRPVNKQTALVTSGGTKEQLWNDDVIKYNAEKLRRQQQEAFNRAGNEYLGELYQASRGNFYAKDYVKFAKRRITRGEWSPGIDANAPTKWVGTNPGKVKSGTRKVLKEYKNDQRREQRT